MWYQALLSEFFGTAVLVLLGNAVVSNVVLKGTKGNNGGWLLITFGWGLAVIFGAFLAAFSFGQLNPAITIAFAITKAIGGDNITGFLGDFSYVFIPLYIFGQILGAILGQLLVYAIYWPHYKRTTDPSAILATHSTSPAIKATWNNLASEIIGTFILAAVVLGGVWLGTKGTLWTAGAITAGIVVLAIGISIGGTTGYAINPARDLIPRTLHFILPIPNKGSSQWGYSWIPVVGPIAGASLAAIMAGIIINIMGAK